MAKKKESKVSIRKFEEMLEENEVVTHVDGFDDIDVTVKHTLPLVSMLEFVEEVVSACIDMDTGEYIPEAKRFAIRKCVLTYYANFTMPDDAEKQYELVYRTDAYHSVMCCIDKNQYMDILEAIDERIKHNVAIMQNGLIGKVSEIVHKVASLTEQSEAAFAGIDANDFNALFSAMAKMGSIDEGKLVDAVIANSSHPVDNIVVIPNVE